MWGRKRARHGSYVTEFTGLGPQPAAGTRGRKRRSFPRSPGGQVDGCTHTRIHPSPSHPVIPVVYERSSWEPLCSCWHKTRWLLRGRIPPVLKISLRSNSLSAGNSLLSWRISFVFLCFPFPFRAEGNSTPFSQAATGLHPCSASLVPTPYAHLDVSRCGWTEVLSALRPTCPLLFHAPVPALSREIM